MRIAKVVFLVAVMIIGSIALGRQADRTLSEAKGILADELGCEPNDIVVYETDNECFYRWEHVARTRVGYVEPDRYDINIKNQKVESLIYRCVSLDFCSTWMMIFAIIIIVIAGSTRLPII